MTDKERRAMYLDLIREGKGPITAAHAVGMTLAAMNSYLDADVAFRTEVEEARAYVLEKIEEATYKSAMEGDFNSRKMVLESHLPDKWTKPSDTLNLNVHHDNEVDVAALHAKLDAIHRKELESGEEAGPTESAE